MKPDDPQFAAVIDGFVEGDHMASAGWADLRCGECGHVWRSRVFAEYGHVTAAKDQCPACGGVEWKPEGE